MPACAQCGTELPEGARFCPACGASVEARPTVALLVESPRRIQTILKQANSSARLDTLAALGDRKRLEEDAPQFLRPNTYLEPFALRALGVVREDEELDPPGARGRRGDGLARHAAQAHSRLP